MILMCFINSSIAAERLITIGGSVTEYVFALGSGNDVVATDTSSYYPTAVNNLPKVGYQRALSAEGILSLKPDKIFLTNNAGPPPVIQQLRSMGIEIITLTPATSIETAQKMATDIASALNATDAADTVLNAITKTQSETKDVSILYVMQHSGGVSMVAGNNTAAASMISLAGFKNAITEFNGYKPLTPEAALALNPDIILTSTISEINLDESIQKLSQITGLAQTTAIKEKNVIVMDALFLLGFGPRVNAAIQTLQQAVYEL